MCSLILCLFCSILNVGEGERFCVNCGGINNGDIGGDGDFRGGGGERGTAMGEGDRGNTGEIDIGDGNGEGFGDGGGGERGDGEGEYVGEGKTSSEQ